MGYSNRTWMCPFFGWDEKTKIHCEAGRIVFGDDASLRAYAERHCGSITGWKSCTMAKNWMDYYARKEP